MLHAKTHSIKGVRRVPIQKSSRMTGWWNRDLRGPIMFLRSVWYLVLIIGAIVAVIGLVLEFAELLVAVL